MGKVQRLKEDESDEFAELLHALGVDRRPSRVVGFLALEGNARSSRIQEALGMRQPEVSQATKALRERGWVVAKPEKTPGKGRPVNNYRLDVSLADIAAEVKAKRREVINEELARIDRLVELASTATLTQEDESSVEERTDAKARPDQPQ